MSIVGLSVFDLQSVSDRVVLLRFVHRFKKQDPHPDVHSNSKATFLTDTLLDISKDVSERNWLRFIIEVTFSSAALVAST